jgi:hypothetical protein
MFAPFIYLTTNPNAQNLVWWIERERGTHIIFLAQDD